MIHKINCKKGFFLYSLLFIYINQSFTICNLEFHNDFWDEYICRIDNIEFEDGAIFDRDKPLFLSLGFNCTVAYEIEINNHRHSSYPFDWIRLPFDGLCSILKNDFNGYLDANFLVLDPHKLYVENIKYGVQFHHDFSKINHLIVSNWLDELGQVTQKYERRIKRFYQAINEVKQVFFIRARSHPYDIQEITPLMAEYLRDILLEKFPIRNWTLVIIDQTDQIKENWNIAQVKNIYLQHFIGPEVSIEINQAWRNIFIELLSNI